jgi:hypothetical protein
MRRSQEVVGCRINKRSNGAVGTPLPVQWSRAWGWASICAFTFLSAPSPRGAHADRLALPVKVDGYGVALLGCAL